MRIPWLKKANYIKLNAAEIKNKLRKSQSFSIRVDNKNLDMIVFPAKVHSDDAEIILIKDRKIIERRKRGTEIHTYRSIVKGYEVTSDVRLSVTEKRLEGFISIGKDDFSIEPLRKHNRDADSDQYIIYRHKDVNFNIPLHKDTEWIDVNLPDTPPVKSQLFYNEILGVTLWCDEGFSNTASDIDSYWTDEMDARINSINSIYSSQCSIAFEIKLYVCDTSDDLNINDMVKLLHKFEATYKLTFGYSLLESDNRQDSGIELAHLFTSKLFNGDQIGRQELMVNPEEFTAVLHRDYYGLPEEVQVFKPVRRCLTVCCWLMKLDIAFLHSTDFVRKNLYQAF